MKKYLALLITLLFLTDYASAQSFRDGVELYESEQFEEAIEILRDVNSDEAILFIGKSYLALGNYPLTRNYLNQLKNSERTSIQQEAEYTKAVLHFKQKIIHQALTRLAGFWKAVTDPVFNSMPDDFITRLFVTWISVNNLKFYKMLRAVLFEWTLPSNLRDKWMSHSFAL